MIGQTLIMGSEIIFVVKEHHLRKIRTPRASYERGRLIPATGYTWGPPHCAVSVRSFVPPCPSMCGQGRACCSPCHSLSLGREGRVHPCGWRRRVERSPWQAGEWTVSLNRRRVEPSRSRAWVVSADSRSHYHFQVNRASLISATQCH